MMLNRFLTSFEFSCSFCEPFIRVHDYLRIGTQPDGNKEAIYDFHSKKLWHNFEICATGLKDWKTCTLSKNVHVSTEFNSRTLGSYFWKKVKANNVWGIQGIVRGHCIFYRSDTGLLETLSLIPTGIIIIKIIYYIIICVYLYVYKLDVISKLTDL